MQLKGGDLNDVVIMIFRSVIVNSVFLTVFVYITPKIILKRFLYRFCGISSRVVIVVKALFHDGN